MAEVNPKVMELVQAEIRKNKDISNKELFDRATALDKSIGKLSARQFNARYPLQVKRSMAPKKKVTRKAASARGRKAAAGGPKRGAAATKSRAGGRSQDQGRGRDQIRNVMLDLAREVANAQGKGDVIDVVAGIDRYVDRVLKAAG